MLTVTLQAAEELKTVAQAQIENPEEAFRLVPTGPGQLALAIDVVREGDQVTEHEGVKILLVGLELTEAVDGLVLDYEETPEGNRFIMSRPDPET